MNTVNIDTETFSSVNLAKSDIYKYVESEDFDVSLFAYAINGGQVQVIDLANGESIPLEFIDALKDDIVLKRAFNAQFERICLSKQLGIALNPRSW